MVGVVQASPGVEHHAQVGLQGRILNSFFIVRYVVVIVLLLLLNLLIIIVSLLNLVIRGLLGSLRTLLVALVGRHAGIGRLLLNLLRLVLGNFLLVIK